MNKAATLDLILTRFIRAPRERVFDAFVDPEMMKKWMCPRGMSVPEIAADARVGGRWRVSMRSRDGETYMAAGEYREIARPDRVAYTWQWEGAIAMPAETLITVSFSERDGGTELRMTHSGFAAAALRDSHEGGWQSCFNRLVDSLDPRGSAATVTLIGDPRSTYVRTARMGLAEKGVKYTLEPRAPHSREVLAVQPFGRVPGLRDGEIPVFETSAILRYVEESFDGPSLLPGSIRDRARCEQWVSGVHCYLYDSMIRRYVLQYAFPKGADGTPDRKVIDPALKDIASHLAILDRSYGGASYLAGASASMADLFVAPILAYVAAMPEGKDLMAKAPNARRGLDAMRERPSFRDTEPARG